MRLILSFLSFCDFSDFFNISYVVNNKIQSNKTFQEKHKKKWSPYIFIYINVSQNSFNISLFFSPCCPFIEVIHSFGAIRTILDKGIKGF